METFHTDTRERRLRRELKELKQRNNFEDFLLKFREISSQMNDMGEDELLHTFMDAVKPKVRYELVKGKVDNLDDAMRVARIFEECYGDLKQNEPKIDDFKKVNYVKREFPKKFRFKRNMSFSKFKSGGRFTRNQNEGGKDNTVIRDKPVVTCFKCKKPGHIAKNCRVRIKQNYHKVNQVIDLNSDSRSESESDHEERKYRTVLAVNNGSIGLPTIKGYINGIEMNLAFDSGATVCCLSHQTALKHGIPILPSKQKIKVADDLIRDVIGETEELSIEIQGHVCKEIFLVINHSDHDALLGMPWFIQTGAGLYPKENILHFNGHKIHLNCDNWTEQDCILLTELEDEEIEEDMCWDLARMQDRTVEVKAEMVLNKEQLTKFNETIKAMIELFAFDLSDLKTCNVGKHIIRTIDCPPVFTPPYRKSQKEREMIKEEVAMMLKLGIIEKSSSPWNSPVIIVPKKDGTRRFVVDYRNVNSVIKNEIWPMPRIDDILDRLSGSKFFSVLDLTSGYWQIEIEKGSRPITSFSTCDAHFQFTRMPFGLKCAPAEFSRIMFQVLGGRDYVEIYLDDITIHSKTFEEHLRHITLVAKALKEANLRIKPSKCKWVCSEISLLGHVVSGGHVAMDPDKVKAIKQREPPRNVKQIQQYLGICNYYRRFIKDYAKIAEPLTRLLKSDQKFEWTIEQQESFKALKEALVSYPILRQPDMAKPFYLFTDASGYCMGAVLAQKDDDGKEHAVAYGSKMLKNSELYWTVTEKECFACVWAIKKYRIYLLGKKFTVITDHSALSWLMNIKDPNGRLARWSIYLQAYEFEIIHRKGLIHSNADTLSRPVMTVSVVTDDDEDLSPKGLDVYEDDQLMYYLKHGKHQGGIPKKQVKRVEKMAEQYSFRENKIIFRKDEDSEEKIVPKPEDRYDIAVRAHRMGHFQVDATLKRLQQDYYWKGMKAEVEKCISDCEQCKRNHKVAPMEHPAKAIQVKSLFDRVGIDLTFGLTETKEGFHGLLTIVEYVSKFSWAYPIKTKSAKEISEKLWEFFGQYGPVKEILTDCGTEFNNELVDQLVRKFSMVHKTTSPWSPRTNGLVERFNHVFVEALRKVVDDDIDNWPDYVPFVLMAFRSKVNTTTNYTPYRLLFGRDMNNLENWNLDGSQQCQTCVDSMFTEKCDCQAKAYASRAKELKRLLEIDHVNAIANIEKRQVQQKKDQNKSHRIVEDLLPIGTKVYVSTTGFNDKLYPKYRGPFTIVERTEKGNYIIENLMKERVSGTFPLQRLKVIKGKDVNQQDEYYRIDKILKDRKDKKGNIEVLIKWKGYSSEHNTWEPLGNLTDQDMYASFLKSKRKDSNDQVKKKKTHKQKIVTKRKTQAVNWLHVCLVCLVLLPLGMANEMTIQSKIYFCEDPSDHPWSLPMLLTEKGCSDWKQEARTNKSVIMDMAFNKIHPLAVMSKHAFEIRGTAYECKMVKKSLKTWETLFGAPFKQQGEQTLKVSVEECRQLVKTKRCGMNQMHCQEKYKSADLNCVFDPILKEIYNWMSTTYDEGLWCQIKAIPIAEHGSYNETKLFDKCNVTSNFCEMDDAIIVWEKEIYENCPFHFDSSVHLLAWQRVGNDLIQHRDKGYFYKITDKLVNLPFCGGASVYKTAEGIYLSDDLNTNKFLKAGVEVSNNPVHNMGMYNHLILSEIDGMKWKEYEDQTKAKTRMCENLLTTLRTLKERDRHFETIVDPLLNLTTVIYADKGVIWLPKCVVLNNFTIDTNRDKICYKDLKIKVSVPHLNKTVGEVHAFLNKANVITSSSKERKCNESIIRIIENKSNNYSLLIELNNKVLYQRVPRTARLYPIENEIFKYNFPHYKELLTDIDIANIIIRKRADDGNRVSDFKTISEIKDKNSANSSISEFLNDANKMLIQKSGIIANYVTNLFSNVYKTIVFSALCIVIILVLIAIIIIFRKFSLMSKFKRYRINNNKVEIKNENIEMEIREQLKELIKINETEDKKELKSVINSPLLNNKNIRRNNLLTPK